MGEWHGHGLTKLCAGFKSRGFFKEAGDCGHLRFGQQAHGYSSIKDSEDNLQVTLYCGECYEQYLIKRAKEAVCCSDCKNYFPRGLIQRYVPYDREGLSEEEAQLELCPGCLVGDIHLERLQIDADKQQEEAQGDIEVLDPGVGPACHDEPAPLEGTMECSDCGQEFRPGELLKYIPVDKGDATREELTLHICPECVEEPQHQARLLNDEYDRSVIMQRRGFDDGF